MMRRIFKFYDGLVLASAIFAGLLVVGMSGWITYEVFVRYVLSSPTIWASDLSGYSLLWATFLAAPWVLRRNAHVSVDLAVARLSPARRKRAAIATSLIGAAVCLIFAWQTGLTVVEFYQRGLTIARIWQIPQYLPYACMPFGATLLACEFILRTVTISRTGVGNDLADDSSHRVMQ